MAPFFIYNMAAISTTTFGDMLTKLAELVGETQQNTADRRKRMINDSYRYIANKKLWWWLETSSTATTTTAVSYALPTTFRSFRERNPLKINSNWYTQINQADLQLHDGSSQIVSLPFQSTKKYFYVYGSTVYFVQNTMTSGQTITYYYYQRIEDSLLMENLTDEPLIPDELREIIPLYAAGMYLKTQGGRESVEGNDYLQLYDTYLKDMEKEDENRRKLHIMRRALDPEEALIYRF